MNFVIYSPGWTYRSAGVRALHHLCDRLNRLGQNAHLYPERGVNPELQTPTVDDGELELLPRPLIAIYPEIIGGNPMGGDVVVRWLLNYPGKARGDVTHTWSETDLLFHWDGFRLGNAERLCLPVIDYECFHNRDNPYEGKRETVWYYSSKHSMAGYPEPKHLGLNLAGARLGKEDLAWVLRRIQKLYLCEVSSIYLEAKLCGCEVEFFLSDYMPKAPEDTVEPSDEEATAMVQNLIAICEKELHELVRSCAAV